MVIYLCHTYTKTGDDCLVIPYLGFVLYTNILGTILSIQFSSVFYIVTVSLIVLHKKRKISIDLFYFIVGIIVNYFDLLTYPLSTLGVPILYTIYYSKKEGKSLLYAVAKYSFLWTIGYGLMWASKWAIASLITKENVIDDAVNQIFVRSSYIANGETFTFPQMISRLFNTGNKVVITVIFITTIFLFIRNKHNKSIFCYKKLPSYILVGIYPFVWYFILSNHSYWHAFFTYRTLSISVLSILFIFVCNFKRQGESYERQ